MWLAAVEKLLQDCMGLHSATIGSSCVSHAVDQRMRDCQISDHQEYLRVLQHSPTERDALIDAVIIPETWFYRDRNPFSAFSAWLSSAWLPHKAHSPLRILSVPCSSGEEPYTLAMCLADLDLPAKMAQIDAVDISHDNIDKAKRARYSNNSFRGGDLTFRDRHFICENQHYKLSDNIRTRVNFTRANILDPAFLLNRQPYHVVFCRNLLIYFDRMTQNLAVERLEQLLAPDGVLFLGHSETSLLLGRNFTSLDYPRCFGFSRGRKNDQASVPDKPARSTGATRAKRCNVSPAATATVKPFSAIQDLGTPAPKLPAPVDSDTLLSHAFELANQGHLDEAAAHCESLLQRGVHQADAHYLLGLIRESAGNAQNAEQMLRKAVYLDPDHYEALTHLSVLALKKGDKVSAQCYQQRATRALRRNQERSSQ